MRRLSKLCVVFSLLNWLAAFTLPSEQKKNTNFVFLANQTSHFLRVSPKAIAQAFKSFHSLLSPNTEYGGQRRVVLATIITPQNPSVPLFLRFLRVSPKATARATITHGCYCVGFYFPQRRRGTET